MAAIIIHILKDCCKGRAGSGESSGPTPSSKQEARAKRKESRKEMMPEPCLGYAEGAEGTKLEVQRSNYDFQINKLPNNRIYITS